MHDLPGPPLPIDPLLPELIAALASHGRAVLQAPPGAGKTTRVPLALLPHSPGRILMLEPRRLAARAAAERMAETLGEPLAQTVGYRIRGEARTSPATRIEVVTEGILTRMLQSDPSLEGTSTLIFDEFHERSLHADLGLALAMESRAALRPDLQILVMSATLDAAPVAQLLDAPILTAQTRAYPVETRWRDRPLPPGTRLETATAETILDALAETDGGLLAFLPGEAEIRRTAAALQTGLPEGCTLRPLYGALPARYQRAALAPEPGARKIVLATAIAETSLTIAGVRVVIDAGRARRARFDPASAMSRLVTERVSRAEAEQRRGRAGRTAPGVCYRLWTRGEEGALPPFAPPEIETADLAPLALELALWGSPMGAGLAFLTPPPAAALTEARSLLACLGALDPQGRITPHGRAMATLPLHPRLAHMLLTAGRQAAPLAALLSDRDPLRGETADLTLRLDAIAGKRRADPASLARLRSEASRLARLAPANPDPLSPAAMATLAYPDRIAQRRPGPAPRYLLSGGKGAKLDAADPLATAPLLAVTDLDGDPREARIRQAAPLTRAELDSLHGPRIHTARSCDWSPRDGRIRARIETRLDALILSESPWPDPPAEARAAAALDAVRSFGLTACGMTPAARRLQARIETLRATGADLPDASDEALLARAEDWLLPHLTRIRTAADLAALNLAEPLLHSLTWEDRQTLDRLAPSSFTTPLGRQIPIDYAEGTPAIEVRLQELFGLAEHPCIGPARTPLKITLLSPAGRPVQVTNDLPGFWASSYAEVRKDMRGRYPKHPWPENPLEAAPTLRRKTR